MPLKRAWGTRDSGLGTRNAKSHTSEFMHFSLHHMTVDSFPFANRMYIELESRTTPGALPR